MPIAFPPPLRGAWFDGPHLLFSAAWFNAVPAPNMEIPLEPYRALPAARTDQGLNGKGYMNVYRLGQLYQNPQITSVLNPANCIEIVTGRTSPCTRVMGEQSIRIVGISYNATGVALGNCVVKVFTTIDDVKVAETVSDGSGNWTVYPNQQGPYYYVEYKEGTPVFGTSPNTNTSTPFTPGA